MAQPLPGAVDDKTAPVVQLEPEPPPAHEEPGVEVDLDAKPNDQKSGDDSEATKLAARIKELESSYHTIARLNTKLQKELEAARQLPAPPPAVELTDELDKKLFSGDPSQVKEALRKHTEQTIQQVMQEQQAKQQLQMEESQRLKTWEDSKREVLEKYPDLDPDSGNPESPLWKTYNTVYNADPQLLKNPYGPVIAMHRMEKELRAQPGNGASRRSVNLMPPRTAVRGTNTVTLTKEQKEFCDRNGIEYATYAKNMKTLENQGGLEA